MSAETPIIDPPSEERLAAALQEYQSALDSGARPNRADLLQRYSDVSDLAENLDVLDALSGVEQDLGLDAQVEPRLDDFEIVREIGRGGMGVVYEARHRSLDRRVAIKVLTHAAGLDENARQRFLHEARVAALINHSNVVPVFQVGEADGTPFFVMPFIDGQSLAEVIHKSGLGPVPFPRIAQIGVQVADALAAAHAQDIVHRDIKPGNLLLDAQGKTWVADFGLAAVPFADGLTRTGARLGTPRYMSPEQIAGPRDRVDSRTDVYSLGITLYELLTSKPAFQGDSETDLIRQILYVQPSRPSQINPAVPHDLETIVLKASAKEPAERYQTARELADDLRRFLDQRPVLAQRPGAVTIVRKWVRRNRRAVSATLITLLTGAFLSLAANILVLWRAYQSEKSARDQADRNLQMAVGALSDLGKISDDVAWHTPGLHQRHVQLLEQVQQRLSPFFDDPSLPLNVRRDIAHLDFRLGVLFETDANLDRALPEFERARSRFDALSAQYPQNGDLQLDRAYVRWRLATIGLLLNRSDLATTWRAEALALTDVGDRSVSDPTRAPLLASRIRFDIASDEEHAGQPGKVLAATVSMLKLHEKLRDQYRTGHPLSYMRLATTCLTLARQYEQLGRLDDAERAWRSVLENDEQLAKEFAHEPPTVRDDTRHAEAQLGLFLLHRGKTEEGERRWRSGIATMEQATSTQPHRPSHLFQLANLYLELACIRWLAGDIAAARSACENCRRHLSALPPTFRAENQAHILLLLPLPEFRDIPAAAAKLAGSRIAGLRFDRALVKFRQGDFAAALEVVPPSKNGIEMLVRAASLAKLGRMDEARQTYDQAVQLLQPPRMPQVQFQVFQREVEELVRRGG